MSQGETAGDKRTAVRSLSLWYGAIAGGFVALAAPVTVLAYALARGLGWERPEEPPPLAKQLPLLGLEIRKFAARVLGRAQ